MSPLIEQLEKVAEAGIGDVTRVAAAQRTVSMIEATKAEVEEQLEQINLDFKGTFGSLPEANKLDLNFLSASIPNSFSEELVTNASLLQAAYFRYQASEAKLASVKAKRNIALALKQNFKGRLVEASMIRMSKLVFLPEKHCTTVKKLILK